MLAKYDEWKYDWEPEYLENTKDFIFKNTFNDIESIRVLKGVEASSAWGLRGASGVVLIRTKKQN